MKDPRDVVSPHDERRRRRGAALPDLLGARRSDAHDAAVRLPGEEGSPLGKIGFRVLLALALIVFVAAITYIGRDGYYDPENDEISVLDAFYYSTVSITTTGYGDIRPVTEGARLATTLLVTPARVLFLILLVGTTLEILAERTRTAYRISRWRKDLKDHTIVCGYGTKGRAAISTLLGQGTGRDRIVVIDPEPEARTEAGAAGFTTIAGSADSQDILRSAGIADALAVIVAVHRDDSAVLVTLTARELAPQATIVVAVREEENVHLLHQSGADSVITSSGAAGRLLGMATHTPQVAEVLEDLLSVGAGLDIAERIVGPGEGGPIESLAGTGPVVAVQRNGRLLRFDDPEAARIEPGDRVVHLRSHPD